MVCFVRSAEKDKKFVFGSLDGWRTYWHQPLFPSSSCVAEETTAAVSAGFLSSIFFSFNFFLMILSPFFFILNNFIRFCTFYCYSLPNLSLSITAWPCSKCTYYPGFPLHWLQSSLQQCSTRTCSHKGRNENWVTHNALYFHLGRKSNFIWRSSIFSLFRISALDRKSVV